MNELNKEQLECVVGGATPLPGPVPGPGPGPILVYEDFTLNPGLTAVYLVNLATHEVVSLVGVFATRGHELPDQAADAVIGALG